MRDGNAMTWGTIIRLQLPRLTCSFDLWGFASTSGLTSRRRLSASSSNRSASALWNALNSSSKGSRGSEISAVRLLLASVSGAMPTVLSHPAAEGHWGILQIPAKVQHRRHGSDRRSRSVAADLWACSSLRPSRSWVFCFHSTAIRSATSAARSATSALRILAWVARSFPSVSSPFPQARPI